MSSVHPNRGAFQEVYGYELLVPGEDNNERTRKHNENALKFLCLIPLIGAIAWVIYLRKAVQDKMEFLGFLTVKPVIADKAVSEFLTKKPTGKALLSLIVISAIGLGILLLPIQIIATFMNLHERCKNIREMN